MVYGNGRDDRIKRARKGYVADVALVQLHAGSDRGQFGAGVRQHLGRYIISYYRALRKTVEQFLRQIPRACAQLQDT